MKSWQINKDLFLLPKNNLAHKAGLSILYSKNKCQHSSPQSVIPVSTFVSNLFIAFSIALTRSDPTFTCQINTRKIVSSKLTASSPK